jgi:hypothetical protein
MKNAIFLFLCSLSVFVNFAHKMPLPKGNIVVNQGESEDNYSKMTFVDNDILIPQDENKMLQVNINEVLWLKKKYNIVKIRRACISFPETELAIAKQEKEIFSKYGNLFWQRIELEVDSIEKKDLGYKKAPLNDFENYLNQNNCTTKRPENGRYKGLLTAQVGLIIHENGKITNNLLKTQPFTEADFSKETCNKFNASLTNVFSKIPFLKPSTFLNKPIEDSVRVYVRQLN